MLPVVTRDVVILDSVPVDVVEDGEADLPAVGLWPGAAGEGPGVLPAPHRLRLAVLPAEGAAVAGDAATRPEVGGAVPAHQPQEVLGLLLGVQRHELHAPGAAVGHAARPVEVVAVLAPRQQVVLALPLVVTLRPGAGLDSLGLPLLLLGGRPGGGRGGGGGGVAGNSAPEGVNHEGLDLQGLSGGGGPGSRGAGSRGGGGGSSGGGCRGFGGGCCACSGGGRSSSGGGSLSGGGGPGSGCCCGGHWLGQHHEVRALGRGLVHIHGVDGDQLRVRLLLLLGVVLAGVLPHLELLRGEVRLEEGSQEPLRSQVSPHRALLLDLAEDGGSGCGAAGGGGGGRPRGLWSAAKPDRGLGCWCEGLYRSPVPRLAAELLASEPGSEEDKLRAAQGEK